MMDANTAVQHDGALPVIDLARFELPLLMANAQECIAHETLLADIDKASKGKTIWRTTSLAT